jgi:2-keto-3-deoxy-L-rhamnonate aldolase RhmA
MRSNPVRTILAEGRCAYGVMAAEFFTPGLCQILAQGGADFVIFDQEHGGVGIDTIKAQLAFARGTGVAPFVRVPGAHYHLIAPVLDAGAMGIMVPMVETVAQAESIARWCRYRPEGVRGVGFGVGHDDYAGTDVVAGMAAENARVVVIALIETAEGIRNADAILAVPGIDVGWLGHFDLTNSMGITAEFDHPAFEEAVADLLAACRRHRKAAGFLATTVAMARAWRAKGFNCLCYNTDIGLLRTALGEALGQLRSDPP